MPTRHQGRETREIGPFLRGVTGRYDRSEVPGDIDIDTGSLGERRKAERLELTPTFARRVSTRTVVSTAYNWTTEHLVDGERGTLHTGRVGWSPRLQFQGRHRRPPRIADRHSRGGAARKGHELQIYDRNVSIARLVGANKQYIEEQIPHLSRHLCDSIDEVIEQSEVIVIGNASPEFSEAVTRCRPDQIVIDLVRLPLDFARVKAQYDGICW